MVITQLREDLIAQTVRSLAGARRVIVHSTTPSRPPGREIVFGMDACRRSSPWSNTTSSCSSGWRRRIRKRNGCSSTSPKLSEWPSWMFRWPSAMLPSGPGMLGRSAPSSSTCRPRWRCATPNVFADQIEWMARAAAAAPNTSTCPCTRTTTVVPAWPCAEQALLAGADRVEGARPVRQRRAQ